MIDSKAAWRRRTGKYSKSSQKHFDWLFRDTLHTEIRLIFMVFWFHSTNLVWKSRFISFSAIFNLLSPIWGDLWRGITGEGGTFFLAWTPWQVARSKKNWKWDVLEPDSPFYVIFKFIGGSIPTTGGDSLLGDHFFYQFWAFWDTLNNPNITKRPNRSLRCMEVSLVYYLEASLERNCTFLPPCEARTCGTQINYILA